MLHIQGEIGSNGIISRIRMLKVRRLIVLNKPILMSYFIEGLSIGEKNTNRLSTLMRTIKIRNNNVKIKIRILK